MSADITLWGTIALVAVALSIPFVVSPILNYRWRSLPRLSDYIAANPQCRTARGIKCVVCNSVNIKDRGLTKAHDKKRVFVCSHCKTQLYRG